MIFAEQRWRILKRITVLYTTYAPSAVLSNEKGEKGGDYDVSYPGKNFLEYQFASLASIN